jgi:hypothetical protein
MAPELVEIRGSDASDTAAGAAARTDTLLRWSLAAAWAAAAVTGPEPWLLPAPVARLALGACAALAALDLWPRASAVAGLAASLAALPTGVALAPWLAVLGAAAARVGLRLGPSGERLTRVREAHLRRSQALLATELHRRRSRRLSEPARSAELGRAGDAFERAGRARAELRALGVERGARPLAPRLAAALTPPALAEPLVRHLDPRD